VRFPYPLSLAGLAALLMLIVAGTAFARATVRPDRSPSVRSLRAVVEHYRQVTWMYERAAHRHRTPTSFSYRQSTDASYLQWTIDVWTRRAYRARSLALVRIHRSLSVDLPKAPALHSRLSARLAYSKRLALRLRRIYPGTVTRRFTSARASTSSATLRLWQIRSAEAAVQVAQHGYAKPPIPAFLQDAFLCIHRFEGAWNSNTGNGYYGGLQMDVSFQSRYGGDYVVRWGTADNWPAWAQLQTAVRAYRAGLGFWPWPNTARACGLI
jgi:hypothetical protein